MVEVEKRVPTPAERPPEARSREPLRAEEQAQEAERGPRSLLSLPSFLGFQIVAQKKMTRPLLLRFGRNAGKSTITVRSRAVGRGGVRRPQKDWSGS